MFQSVVPADTDPAVFELLVDKWRSMSVADRVELVERINADVELLAVAGIRRQHPDMSEVEVRKELAQRRYGPCSAEAAFAHVRRR